MVGTEVFAYADLPTVLAGMGDKLGLGEGIGAFLAVAIGEVASEDDEDAHVFDSIRVWTGATR